MKIEEAGRAMENGSVIRHTYGGVTIRYALSGVISQYSAVRGWFYSLELRDLKSGCVVIASLEDCEVEEGSDLQ